MKQLLTGLSAVLTAAMAFDASAYSLRGTNDTTVAFEDQPGRPFMWHRFTIRQVLGKGTQTGVNVDELGLFDASGERQNVGLTVKNSGAQSSLAGGDMCWDSMDYQSTASDRGLEKMVDDDSATCTYAWGKGGLPQLGKESSWLSLTMRLASGKNPVTSYDAIPVYDASNGRTLRGYSLKGSADGQTWFLLDEQQDRPYSTDATFKWQSDSSIFEAGASHQGYPVASHESGTYVLSGDGTSGLLKDVDNGRYCRLSVVKNGSGVWTLGGRQTFTGDLLVNAGTLKLEPFRNTYKWFKLVIKQSSATGDNCVGVGELGLFDRNGERQNGGMIKVAAGTNVNLQPGCACLNWTWPVASGRDLDKAFDDVAGDIGNCLLLMPTSRVDPNNSGTWITILMRLAPDANPIASYDVLSIGFGGARGIRGYELWGGTSIDSTNWNTGWDLLDSESDRKCDETKWQSNNEDFAAGAAHKGYPISSSPKSAEVHDFLDSAASIRVATGACLEALSPMTLDHLTPSLAGNGTYAGFSFAEEGVVDVDETVPHAYAITFEDCTGLSNLTNWQVRANGVIKKNWWVEASGNRLTVCSKGLVVLVR